MSKSAPPVREAIAIVGVTALHPGSTDAEGFWRDILAGRDLLTDVPANYWLIEDYYDPDPKAVDKTYGKRGGFLTPVDFDALEFGMPPNALASTDAAQLLGLIGAKRVLADAAGGRSGHVALDRTSVILGVAGATAMSMHVSGRLQRPAWVKGLRESGLPESAVQAACDRIAECFTPFQESTFPGLLGNVVAGRIANRFNLGGSNFTVDAACAGSLAAISVALNELYLHQADMVITGGVDALNDILMFMCFSKTPALSATGDCRPFSDKADGTMLGEGLSMFALRRLSDAERDGDKIYAVIRGLGSSSDGRAKSVYAPRPEGQAVALRRAYEAAGFGPETIELVEAHGTGTQAGDAAEFESLRTVFGETGRADRQWCALGSVKSQIGHSKGAAGAAALFKAVMALHHKVLPPTIKVDQPNPKLGLESSPFYLNTEARPWIRAESYPRRAAVSSFGFGGTNFHLVLEEYLPTEGAQPPTMTPPLVSSPVELIVLSAQSAGEIAAQCEALAARLAGGADWRHLAAQLSEKFVPSQPARLALVLENAETAQKQLEAASRRLSATKETRIWDSSGFYFQTGAAAGPVAFLFAGQGSQYVGMGADLAMTFDPVRAAWDFAETTLTEVGASIRDTVFPRPVFNQAERSKQAERLTQTEWAQPALAAAGLAHLAILKTLGVTPDFTAGHSFGELLALHAAGVLSANDLLRTARVRGALMAKSASIAGAMTAVSHSVAELRPLLAEWNLPVVLANHNSPSQAVLSGSLEALAEVEKRLSAASIAFQRLRVSAAFHSPLVAESVPPFAEFLQSVPFSAASVPVFSNSEAAPYPVDSAAARQMLAQHLARPVRFAEQIEALYAEGARIFIELGAGSTLSKLTTQCLAGREFLAVALDQKGKHGVDALWQALGQLAAAGMEIPFVKLQKAFAPPIEAKSVRNPTSTFSVDGAGYNRPYPPVGGAEARPKPNPEHVALPVPPPPVPVIPVRSAGFEGPERTSRSDKSATLVPPTKLAPASPPVGGALNGNWQEAMRELQAQISETQKSAQAAILESLSLTLNSMETLARQMGPWENPTQEPPRSWPAAPVSDSEPELIPSQPVAPPQASALPAARPPIEISQPSVETLPRSGDLQSLLLEIVAEKTGYPAEVLNLDMELESGLGIDSIKRVEIFSAMQQKAVGLPEVTAEDMASLRTLREIITFLSASPQGAPNAPSFREPAPSPASAPAEPSRVDLQKLLLEVVAEKTGYPTEVLNLDMELESGLGIDSIKRVEIFSAMQQKAVGLPEVTAEDMASLRTLREIITFLSASPQGATNAPPFREPAPSPAPAEPSRVDLQKMLLEVVAEKTGYPTEVLNLDMELESGLGIDSIKRVEIFSAMQQKAVGLPEVTAEDMASLRTLREITTFLSGSRATTPNTAVPAVSQSDAAEDQPLCMDVREVDSPAVGLPLAGLFACSVIAVTDDGGGVAPALVARLAAFGIHAQVVHQLPEVCPAVIFLGGLKKFSDVDQAIAVNYDVFVAAKTAAQQPDGPMLFVSVQDTGGDFGLTGGNATAAWSGGIAGVVKTAAREWPQCSLKVIDLERANRSAELLAEAILTELLEGGGSLEVGLHADGRRTTLSTEVRAIAPATPSTIDENSVIVASGGARGVTAACLIELAKLARPRFAILGRTHLEEEPSFCAHASEEGELKRLLARRAQSDNQPLDLAAISNQVSRILANREIRSTLQALEQAGSAAIYLAVDIQDPIEVAQSLDQVRAKWGPITGIIHGAGILADRKIADKTPEQFQRVFSTKVLGLRSLLHATANDPLQSICLFSSVSARFGNSGQCDYAAANEVLNKVAAVEACRRPSANVKSLNWGPWAGGMVNASLAAHFRTRGIPLIPVAAGSRLFAEEMCARAGGVEVIVGSSLQSPPPPKELHTELLINSRTYPLFNGHRVKDDPVVAVVLVMEWFHRAAAACRPEFAVAACKDLRVLRGVVLPRFEQEGHLLRIHCQELPGGTGGTGGTGAAETSSAPTLHCELRSRDNQLHYCARIELRAHSESLPLPKSSAPRFLPNPRSAESHGFYNEALFHGPEFQVLHSVDGIDGEGAQGSLHGHFTQNWRPGPWMTEAAGCDGALQLLLLWGREHLGGPSLPTRLGHCVHYGANPIDGLIHSVVRCRKVGNLQTISDISLRHSDGRPIADLFDVEMHLIPGNLVPRAEA